MADVPLFVVEGDRLRRRQQPEEGPFVPLPGPRGAQGVRDGQPVREGRRPPASLQRNIRGAQFSVLPQAPEQEAEPDLPPPQPRRVTPRDAAPEPPPGSFQAETGITGLPSREQQPTGELVELTEDEAERFQALDRLRQQPSIAEPAATREPRRFDEMTPDEIEAFLNDTDPDNLVGAVTSLVLGIGQAIQTVDEPAGALFASRFIPSVREAARENREAGMSTFNAAIAAYNDTLPEMAQVAIEFGVSPTWLLPFVGAPAALGRAGQGGLRLARATGRAGAETAEATARRIMGPVPRPGGGPPGRRAIQGGQRLLPDLETAAGIRAEIQRLDNQIRTARRRRESAAPALETTERQSAGLGPGVTVESLQAEKAQLEDLLEQTARREGAEEAFAQVPQEPRPRQRSRRAEEAVEAGRAAREEAEARAEALTPKPAVRGTSSFPEVTSPKPPGGEVTESLAPDPLVQLRDALSGPDRPPLIKRVLNRIPSEFYDRNFALKELQTKTGVPARDLAQVVPGATADGQAVIDVYYRPVVTRIGKDSPQLEEYMSLQRMNDIMALSPEARLPGGIKGSEGVAKALENLRNEVGPERFAEIEQAAGDLWRLNREQVLEPMRREGLLSDEQFEAMAGAHPHYVPFQRADFNGDLLGRIAESFTRPEASVTTTGIRRLSLEGSERRLDDPLGRLLAEPVKARQLVYRNRAARGIADALEEMKQLTGDEDLIRPVTGEAEESAVTGTISFFRNGQQQRFQVPAPIAAVAKNLENEPDHMLLRFVRGLNAPLRRGAIEFNPFYIPAAVMRDAMSAMFRENVFPFGPDWWRGMISAFKRDDLFMEAADSGALMSGLVEQMRAPTAVQRARLGGIQLDDPLDLLLAPFRTVSEVNVRLERGTRLGVFRKLRNEGIDQLSAAVRARDATVDFSKMGNTMRVINSLIPFSNAALQGNMVFARTLKDHPARSMAYAALFSSVAAMTRANNMRYETSEDIPDYEYTRNWVVQFGEGQRADGTKFPVYAKVPKGEIAAVLSFPAEVLFSWNRKTEDRKLAEVVIDQGMMQAQTLTPVDPGFVPPVPIIETGAGLAANRNLFTGAPIVPRSEERLPTEQQFGPDTSRLAVLIGQQTGISPRKVEFALTDYTAGLGQSLNWLTGLGLEAAGFNPVEYGRDVREEPLPEGIEAVSEVPGTGRFIGTRGNQLIRRGFEVLRETEDETSREFLEIPGMKEMGISLGTTSPGIDLMPGLNGGALELTPSQRAELQRLYGEIVTPFVREYAEQLDLPNGQQKRELVNDRRIKLRDIARKRFVAESILPNLDSILQDQRMDGRIGDGAQRSETGEPQRPSTGEPLRSRVGGLTGGSSQQSLRSRVGGLTGEGARP